MHDTSSNSYQWICLIKVNVKKIIMKIVIMIIIITIIISKIKYIKNK